MLSEHLLNKLPQIVGFQVSLVEAWASVGGIEGGAVGWPPDEVAGYKLGVSHRKGASEGVT